MHLTDLSDEALLASLSAVCLEGRRVLGRLLVHLIEIEDRRLDLAAAYPSLFEFCVRRLGMSEGEAFRRINAARLVRRFPSLLGRIERGELHLSGLVILRDHLTDENVEHLADVATGKTKRELHELVARLAPRPDVPETIRELPTDLRRVAPGAEAGASAAEPRRDEQGSLSTVEPLAPSRYRVELTIGEALRGKIERARELMSHGNPRGDLETIFERARGLLLDKLERRQRGKARRPPPTPPPANEDRVTQAVRREVFARDGDRCTFHDAEGNRCPARSFLELDHVIPQACGGECTVDNLRVRCRPHNRLYAEQTFGRDHVAARIHLRQRTSKARAMSPPTPEGVPARTSPSASDLETATRALTGMGFRLKEVCAALERVAAAGEPARSIQDTLRAALRVLT